MADRFYVGDTVTLSNTFKVAGTATDPTTISLTVTDPSGTATTYTHAGSTITKTATGVYTKDLAAPSAGLWSYKWTGTGTAADVENGSFHVEPLSPITVDTLDVLTLLEGKVAVGITGSDTTSDTALAQKITAVSRKLDRVFGPIVQRTITGEVHPGGHETVILRHRPVTSYASVTEYSGTTGTVLTAEDYDTQPADGYSPDRWQTASAPYSGVIRRRFSGNPGNFARGPEAVRVTYLAGRYTTTATVDPLFKEAAGIMLANLWRQSEPSVLTVGEFDVPSRNFPTFGLPNASGDLLEEELLARVGFGG
ncbi:MAG: hypothetical protein KA755_01475 [Candidatus Microthrix sp.]|nr:hypothetical protein [Candidatus Microthrix sp.]